MIALGIGKGDNVITTPITFAATANAALYTGANVYFVDIDPDTYLIDLDKVETLIKQHPEGFFNAILPVDFAGLPVNSEKLKNIADRYQLKIIEDACHAPGAYFIDSQNNKQKTGNGKFAGATAFSFHPVKHIAAGEGGMITTNDKKIYQKLLKLRTHGISKKDMKYRIFNKNKQGGWYYEMHDLGFNYRITDIQAALGNSQLKRADTGLQKRQEIARKYKNAFKDLPVKYQKIPENSFHAYHLFIIEIENRKSFYDYLHQNGILAQVHYIPVHLLDYYSRFGWQKGDFPIAENYYDKTVSLPMFPSLTDDEQNYVIDKVKAFFG